jgi:hypothetical protein
VVSGCIVSVVSSVAQTVGAQLHAQTEAQRKREAEERLKLESANADLRKVHPYSHYQYPYSHS